MSTTCVLSLLLLVLPVNDLHNDEIKQESMIIQGCNRLNHMVSMWIKGHRLIIETGLEYIQIPLPPVREKQEIWVSVDLQTDSANMGNWGHVMLTRGPKESL